MSALLDDDATEAATITNPPYISFGGNGVPGVNVLGNYRLRGMHRLRARAARANCVVIAGSDVSHRRALGSVSIAESFMIEREVLVEVPGLRAHQQGTVACFLY